jgi:hypothetical protein
MLFLHLRLVPLCTRQSHAHVRAQTKGDVVQTLRHSWCDGQVRPSRELGGDHSLDERDVDVFPIEIRVAAAMNEYLPLISLKNEEPRTRKEVLGQQFESARRPVVGGRCRGLQIPHK